MAHLGKLIRYGAGVGCLTAAVLASGAGKPGRNPDYGYVLADMGLLFHKGDEKIDCPQGRSFSTQDAFLASQTPAERARLMKPENAEELERRYKIDYVYGPDGKDICTDADAFDTPDRVLQKPTQSKIGPGMDLDGARGKNPAPGTCAHESFISPTGEAGVDNQYYRAIACNTFWRGVGDAPGDALGEVRWHDQKAVAVVLRQVQSWENDPQVQVLIAATPNEPPVDATKKVIEGGSLTLGGEARYRAVLNGRITNGVLTTDPTNLVLPMSWVGGSGGEFILNHARIRARLTADGELSGEAGGYRPIDNAMAGKRVGGPGVASTAGLECASLRKTLRLLADGDRDPASGQCTSVSTGLSFLAKPAFVFDKGVLIAAPSGATRRAQQ